MNETEAEVEIVVPYMNTMPGLYDLMQLDTVLKKYLIPVDIFFGMAGNSLSAILFKSFHDKGKKITPMLSAVAIVDIGYLFSLLLTWLNNQAIQIYTAPGLCQIKIFCSHYFAFLSFWYLGWTVFLIMLASIAPSKYNALRSSGMARLCLVGISVFSFTGHLYKTWTYGSISLAENWYCALLPENQEALQVLNVFDTFFMQVTPSLVFIIFHIFLVFCCVRIPLRSGSVSTNSTDTADEFRIVLTLTILYQVCILPIIITSVVSAVSNDRPKKQMIIFNILHQPFYAYFALKPIVYVIVSTGYRQAFVSCIKTIFNGVACNSRMSRAIAVPTEETTTV